MNSAGIKQDSYSENNSDHLRGIPQSHSMAWHMRNVVRGLVRFIWLWPSLFALGFSCMAIYEGTYAHEYNNALRLAHVPSASIDAIDYKSARDAGIVHVYEYAALELNRQMFPGVLESVEQTKAQKSFYSWAWYSILTGVFLVLLYVKWALKGMRFVWFLVKTNFRGGRLIMAATSLCMAWMPISAFLYFGFAPVFLLAVGETALVHHGLPAGRVYRPDIYSVMDAVPQHSIVTELSDAVYLIASRVNIHHGASTHKRLLTAVYDFPEDTFFQLPEAFFKEFQKREKGAASVVKRNQLGAEAKAAYEASELPAQNAEKLAEFQKGNYMARSGYRVDYYLGGELLFSHDTEGRRDRNGKFHFTPKPADPYSGKSVVMLGSETVQKKPFQKDWTKGLARFQEYWEEVEAAADAKAAGLAWEAVWAHKKGMLSFFACLKSYCG